MPSIDPVDRRMFANEKTRREQKIRALAASIAEHAGYLLRAVDERPAVAYHAQRIEADVTELRRVASGLDALNDVAFILAEED